MSISGALTHATTWLESQTSAVPELALFGFVMVIIVVVVGAGWFAYVGARLILKLRSVLKARAIRKSQTPGYQIIFCKPSGRGAGPLGRRLMDAIEAHLPTYNFAAPYQMSVFGALGGGLKGKTIARARRRLAASNADMIIWGERIAKGASGFEIYGLSRGGGLRADEARPFTVMMPAKASDWTDACASGAAYLLAKKLQPALARPQSFRAEKMKQLAGALQKVIDGGSGLASPVQAEIETDFCASGVHVAEASGDLEALEQVISLRRGHLADASAASEPHRTLQARLDLGRALLVKAEKQFDASVLEEAIRELALVVEALRDDPAIERAQAASDAMFKAQTMIENRKRFSLNFGS